jgi:hypothetical protein
MILEQKNIFLFCYDLFKVFIYFLLISLKNLLFTQSLISSILILSDIQILHISDCDNFCKDVFFGFILSQNFNLFTKKSINSCLFS